MSEHDEPHGGVPHQGTDPIVWDPVQRRFVPESERAPAPAAGAAPTPAGAVPPDAVRPDALPPDAVRAEGPLPAAPRATGVSQHRGPDPRRFRVGSKAVGKPLPPQPGTPPAGAARAGRAAAGAAAGGAAAGGSAAAGAAAGGSAAGGAAAGGAGAAAGAAAGAGGAAAGAAAAAAGAAAAGAAAAGAAAAGAAAAGAAAAGAAAAAARGARRVAPPQALVPAPDVAGSSSAAPPRAPLPPPADAPAAAPARAPLPLPRNAPAPGAAGGAGGAKPPKDRGRGRNGKPRRFLPGRPKLRRVIMLLPVIVPLLVIVLIAGGLWYANTKFNELHRVPVGNVLDAEKGSTNILLVGSDTRVLPGVSSDASGIFGDASNSAPSGQRSDTIVVLRLDSSGAHTLSVPRDLIVTLAESGKRDRINSAYNTDLGGGPVRLIKTVKDALRIPINRYMEVDFGTFAGVVDAVGGINIDFPNPAFDDNTGLNITTPGTHHLNGEQSLEYVRSRHYTEIINGKQVADPTADLGRIKRQQAFLAAVFSEVGGSKNPFTLLKVGGEVVKGLRVDDKLGFIDALLLGWDLKGKQPQSVELPVEPNADNATLRLRADADTALTQFR